VNDDEVDELAEEALNAACLVVQRALGVKSGDLASHVFSDNAVKSYLKGYIRSELRESNVAD